MTDQTDWKEKCLVLEKTLKTLSGHCYKVVEKHEELLDKYKKNEEQYDLLVKKLEEREKELKHVQQVLEPAYFQYEAIKERYEEAVQCQQQAESYASNVTKEYKNLQRKSQMILDIPDAANLPDVVDDHTKNYFEEKTQEITRLKEEKATLHAQMSELQEDLTIERDNCSHAKKRERILKSELKQTQHSLDQHKLAIKQLSKVSESAIEEYEVLKNEYELEAVCRNKAEMFASKLYNENTAIKRQSSVLLQSVASDVRLMTALNEIEDLTTNLESVKADYTKQIAELEEELNCLKDDNRIVSLESDNSMLIDDRNSLQKQLIDFQQQYASLESQYKTLQTQNENVQKKYEDAIKPPPPPPPPPLPTSHGLGFLFKKKKKTVNVNEKLKTGGAQVNEGYSKALEEMMKRIKEGKPLTKVLRPTGMLRGKSESDENQGGAMEELHSILSKMKRTRSEPDILSPAERPDNTSEFANTFKKIRGGGGGNTEEPDAVFQPKPLPKPRIKALSAVEEEESVDES